MKEEESGIGVVTYVKELKETKYGIEINEDKIERREGSNPTPITKFFKQTEYFFYTITYSFLSLSFHYLFIGPTEWISNYLLPIFLENTISNFYKLNSRMKEAILFLFGMLKINDSKFLPLKN